jgi:hypothetical protein
LGAFDSSLLHNAVFHGLARSTGRYSSRTRYVEVFRKTSAGPVTTNDYFGLYLVLERPRRGPDRINITRLDAGDVSAAEVTGGYILRLDRVDANERAFLTPRFPAPELTDKMYGGEQVVFDDPKGPELFSNAGRAAQRAYVVNYFTRFLETLAGPNFADPTNGYRAFIDVDNWIDNSIINVLCFNVDAYRLTSYLHKERGGKLQQGPWWDCDRGLGSGGSGVGVPISDSRPFNPRVWRAPTTFLNADQGTDFFGLSGVALSWWDRLFRDPDFWQRWIDRYQELRTGPLSTSVVAGVVDGFAREIQEAQEREQRRWSASFSFPRWGVQVGFGYTNDFGPMNVAMPRGGFYSNEVVFLKRWLSDRLDFIDTNFLARPTVSLAAGPVAPGAGLRVEPAAKLGTILLYTLDGTDPRAPGGGITPQAQTNVGPLNLLLTRNIRLVARSYNPAHFNLTTRPDGLPQVGNPPSNSFWSGPVTGTYYLQLPNLRVTEIHYHPAPVATNSSYSAQELEFIELKNAGDVALEMAGFRLSGGVSATLSNTSLAAGGHGVVVRNRAAFQAVYGTEPLVLGEFAGDLADTGETLVLRGPLDEPIFDFRFEPIWALTSDGLGFSLVMKSESFPLPPASPAYWRASAEPGGSPGREDPSVPPTTRVVINEILAQPLPPGFTAIELLNLDATLADISGWYLTDDHAMPQKFRIPQGTVLGHGGLQTFFGTSFDDAAMPASQRVRLSPQGGEVYVFAARPDGTLSGYVHGFRYGASAPGASFGRHVISTGEERLAPQAQVTLSSVNSSPKQSPVVLSEIAFHPANFVSGDRCVPEQRDEFVEIHNATAETVSLGSAGASWRLQGAVQFSFPPGAELRPGHFAAVVGFSTADEPARLNAFRSSLGAPEDTQIFGPWTGSLPDDHAVLELAQATGLAGSTGRPLFAVAERVAYSSTEPWPSGANGTSLTLQRFNPAAFADDPDEWTASGATLGRSFVLGAPPQITQQPVDASEPATGRVEFSGAAEGGGEVLRYAWRFNGCLLRDATNRTLVLRDIRPTQAGLYELLAYNLSGVAVSRPVRLTVLTPVLVTAPPQSQRVREGNSATFRVTASTLHPPLTYQWLHDGTPIEGATNATLEFLSVRELDAGDYRVALHDGNGFSYTPPAVLSVVVRPSVETPEPPLHLTAVEGGSVTFSARTHGTTPMLYRWRHIPPVGSPRLRGDFVIDRNEGFFNIPSVTSADAGIYTLILTNEFYTAPNVQHTNAFLTVLADTDHDGLADEWELQHFGSIEAGSPTADDDHDGVNNRDEFASGTDPKDGESYLKVERVSPEEGVRLEFLAAAGHTYTTQVRESANAEWKRLADVVAAEQARIIEVVDANAALSGPPSARFYRLATPRVP